MDTDAQPSPLGERLRMIYQDISEQAGHTRNDFSLTDRDAECSRDNLLAYLALRERDLRELQLELAEEGLSSLGRLESAVLASLRQVLKHLGASGPRTDLHAPTAAQARTLLAQRSRALLGRPRTGRATRIMVTIDTAVLSQPELLEQLLFAGMDIARINCAHDTEREWALIVDAIRQAEERLQRKGQGVGRRCRILMDLGGPKVRTGPLQLETRPLKLPVAKDQLGRPCRLLEGYLDSQAALTTRRRPSAAEYQFVIALPGQPGVEELRVGEVLRVEDTRERVRRLYVLERISPTRVKVGLERTAYVQEGTVIRTELGVVFTVGPVMPQPVDLRVQAGETLRLYRDPARPGHAARDGQPAGIGCTLPEILAYVKPGHRVFIDDGKIAAVVRACLDDGLELEIISPRGIPARIRSEKGLNFPDSEIDLPALTAQDRSDLAFVVKHASAVGLSFVHRPQDLADLCDELRTLGHADMGIVIKIETREASHRLAQLLLAGLALPKFGVMIARGDLAVEVGFERLALVQEDILCLCEAAHVPVIWATQVLETLAKSGLPARAEITDAAMGQRSECVMLNKGEHVLDAVRTLNELLSSQERHHIKKRQLFREITAQHGIFQGQGLSGSSMMP
ncbi:MAG TPA: pyruvate kinase [Nitrospiria bacterium]|nr:pyruvate kinase [Nitrospiria bacterium]